MLRVMVAVRIPVGLTGKSTYLFGSVARFMSASLSPAATARGSDADTGNGDEGPGRPGAVAKAQKAFATATISGASATWASGVSWASFGGAVRRPWHRAERKELVSFLFFCRIGRLPDGLGRAKKAR